MQTPTPNAVSNHDNEPLCVTKRIDSTNYKIIVHTSKTSKETMSDKIIRLIEREALRE
jgi:hypothetical protein